MEEIQEAQGGAEESNDWVKLRDRGGLRHASNTMFMILSSMESVVKLHASTQLQDFNAKGVLTEKILSSDEVDESLSVNWDDKASNTLLGLIVEQWITIRGFAYMATGWSYIRAALKRRSKSQKA